MMKLLYAAFALVPLLTLAIPALGSDSELSRMTLTGLRGVYVLAQTRTDAQKAGFDKGTFLTDVEVRLRTAGIRVLTEGEMLTTPGMPFLYVLADVTHWEGWRLVSVSEHLDTGTASGRLVVAVLAALAEMERVLTPIWTGACLCSSPQRYVIAIGTRTDSEPTRNAAAQKLGGPILPLAALENP
jgi:hypothetical protein